MHPKWEPLFNERLSDLRRYQEMQICENEQAECCYRVACNYWLRAKELFLQQMVYDDSEELEFFREIKPAFTAYIEYYMILNQGLLFIPPDPVNEVGYWEEEAKRYERFCSRNETFIQYYESKRNDHEAEYFLQRNNQQTLMPQEWIYDDKDCRSSHDHLVRGLLANRMYRDYVQQKLKVLNQRTTV